MGFFVRVDDRLIHGQVIHGWVPYLKTRRIVVVDEALAQDEERKAIAQLSVPREIELHFVTVEELSTSLLEDRNTLVLFSSPLALLRAVEQGLTIERVNLGNLHFEEGKITLKKTFCCTPEELEALKVLQRMGVRLYYQPAPEVAPSELPALDSD